MTRSYEPEIRIRTAIAADAPLLILLDTVAPDDSTRVDAIAAWIADGSCFLAECDSEIAGYGAVAARFFGRPFLEMLMVAPNFRRHGIGASLVAHAMTTCPGAHLWTSTNQSNLPMQALLDRLGFIRSGIIEGLDEGDPELIYRSAEGQER